MALSTGPGERDIVAALRAGIQGVTFRRGAYLDDSHKLEVDSNGLFEPYVLVEFDGPYRFPADNSLAGARKDTQRHTVRLYCVAAYDEVAGQIKDSIAEILTGFRPTDGSGLEVSTGYSFTDADLGYNRYVRVVGFQYLFNLS